MEIRDREEFRNNIGRSSVGSYWLGGDESMKVHGIFFIKNKKELVSCLFILHHLSSYN